MSAVVLACNSFHENLDAYNDLFNTIAPKFGIEPNLVKAHCEYESNGDAKVVGGSGRGLGLMQIDYGTYKDDDGKWWYSSVHGRTDQIFEPSINIMIACRDFLAPLKVAFPENLLARIAGYNAGIGAVETALEHGTPLSQVTYDPNYVRNILRAFDWFDELSSHQANT